MHLSLLYLRLTGYMYESISCTGPEKHKREAS